MPDVPAATPIASRGYSNADVLVDCDWVARHLDDPKVRLLEINGTVESQSLGHIPGAIRLDWATDLNDPLTRDVAGVTQLERLLRECGIDHDTIIVLHGDLHNAWACYGYWVLKLHGVGNLRLLDGGRERWIQEGRPLGGAPTSIPQGNISLAPRDDVAMRAFRDQVVERVATGGALVDVRSPEEFRGEQKPDAAVAGAQRLGHIPGARNVPWTRVLEPDSHVFRDAASLREMFEREQGLEPDGEVTVYCQVGERSAHTWFVLTELLGWSKIRNYDGSWTEWGNTVRTPIERP